MYSPSNDRSKPVKQPPIFSEHQDGKEEDVFHDATSSFLTAFGQTETVVDVDSSRHPDCYYLMKEHESTIYTPRMPKYRLTESSHSSRAKCSSYLNIDEIDDKFYPFSEPFISLINDRQIAFRPDASGGPIVPADVDDLYGTSSYEDFVSRNKDLPARLSSSRTFFSTMFSDLVNRRVFYERVLSPLINAIHSVFVAMMGHLGIEVSIPSQISIYYKKHNFGKTLLEMFSYVSALMWNGFIVMGGGNLKRKSI